MKRRRRDRALAQRSLAKIVFLASLAVGISLIVLGSMTERTSSTTLDGLPEWDQQIDATAQPSRPTRATNAVVEAPATGASRPGAPSPARETKTLLDARPAPGNAQPAPVEALSVSGARPVSGLPSTRRATRGRPHRSTPRCGRRL